MKSLRYALVCTLLITSGQMTFAAPQDNAPNVNPRAYNNTADPRSDERRPERSERHRHMQDDDGEGHRPRERGGRSGWKIGAPIPEDYRVADYAVDYTQYAQLSAPSRYQQWIKVDNRFVLINVLTNTTLKVITEAK